jgi:hypothetical protein
MAHSHYVMDLNYRDARNPERFTREVLRIDAKDDAEAEVEGRRIDSWRNTDFFLVRSIQKSAKSGERLIFDSRTEHVAEAPTEAVIIPVVVQDGPAPAPLEAVSE